MILPALRRLSAFAFNTPSLATDNDEKMQTALHEIERQLAPTPPERLRQIVSRLMLHFPLPEGDQNRFYTYYVTSLKNYPEDLLCAAYQHVLRHHCERGMPKIAAFMSFMEPEMYRRQNLRDRLEALLQKTQAGEHA